MLTPLDELPDSEKDYCSKCGQTFRIGRPPGFSEGRMKNSCSENGCGKRFYDGTRAGSNKIVVWVEKRHE